MIIKFHHSIIKINQRTNKKNCEKIILFKTLDKKVSETIVMNILLTRILSAFDCSILPHTFQCCVLQILYKQITHIVFQTVSHFFFVLVTLQHSSCEGTERGFHPLPSPPPPTGVTTWPVWRNVYKLRPGLPFGC